MDMEDLNGMSDKELVELASVGEMKAIEVLYSRHYELLLNFGMKYFSDIDFVKDCIQDLFAIQLSPWCCDNSSFLIMLSD